MSEPLGAWKKAPLAYVLAEVRTEQIADLKEYKATLASTFRKEYPIQRMLQSARFVATSNGLQHVEPDDENAWEYATPDNHTGVIVRPNGLVLHATKYQTSENFLRRLHDVVAVMADIVPNVFVNRFGLRYVDFILPRKGEQPEQYIDQRLCPMLDLARGSGPITAMSLAVYPMDPGKLTIRYVRSSGKPGLPPDLATFALEKSARMQEGLDDSGQATAIIDTDRIVEFSTRAELEPSFVVSKFKSMHADVSSSFKKIITDHARVAWGAK